MKENKYVLEVKEFIKTPNNFYLVMQLCNGGNLQEFIDDSYNPKKPDLSRSVGIPPTEVRGIMFQIVDAFAQLCKHNLLQTDLKPNNIMLHY